MSAQAQPRLPSEDAPATPAWIAGSGQPGRPWAALERDWKLLYHAAGEANPFLSWEWQSGWAERPGAREQVLVVAQPFASGGLAGLLALQRRRRRGLQQVEFLGQGSGGDELDCLLHPAAPAGLAARLLRLALRQQRWSLLRLESARAQGELAAAARETGPAWGLTLETGEALPTLRLPRAASAPEGFEALLAQHSPNFRQEVRRRRRRWSRTLPQAWLECAATPAAVAAALPHLFRLHNARRARLHSAGIFVSPRLQWFHSRVAPQLAARGAARVYLWRTPGAVLAALYGFEAGPPAARRFLYFQSGLDPELAHLSPGTILLSSVIEDCIARGLQRFEFLRGDESYKRRWTSEQTHSVTVRGARGVPGRAYAWLRRRRLGNAEVQP
jgi:CelD/BcsL family acetyltransferase involved in cellulose biosynthesis